VNGFLTVGSSAAVTLNGTTPTATVQATNAYTPGVELPATGGPGTAAYTASGLALILGALWMLLRRRRETN
jgi:LPXTG-motif cell wall-anchored protein